MDKIGTKKLVWATVSILLIIVIIIVILALKQGIKKKPAEIGSEEYINEREMWCSQHDLPYILCLAELHGDISFCETVEDKEMKQSCKEYFFTEPCEKIGDEDRRNNCFAEEKGDPSYCENIKDNDVKNICLTIVLGEASYCEGLTEERSREMCKNTFSESWPDESLCIEDDACYDQIYYDSAIAKMDNSFCDKIKDENKKEKCLNLDNTGIED